MNPPVTGLDGVLFKDLLTTTKDGDWGKTDPTSDHLPYRVIRGTDFARVRGGDLSTVPLRYLAEGTVWRRTLEPFDVLIETAGGTSDRPTGRSLLVTPRILDELAAPATCASFARFIRINPEIADPAYVFWHLQDLYQRDQMRQHEVRHTGVGRFQYTNFSATHHVHLPPLPEQRGIAATLGALEDKIESNRRAQKAASELIDALAQYMLMVHPTRTVRLAELVEFNGITKRPDNPADEVGYVDIASVSPGRVDSVIRTTWEHAPSRARRGVSDGDVIYSTVRPGRRSFSGILDPDKQTVVSTGFAVMSPEPSLGTSLLTTVAGSPEFALYLESVAHGSAYPAVSVEAMGNYVLEVPADPEVVQDFEVATMPLRRRSHQMDPEIRTLEVLRDTLLPELLSGRIRVPEAREAIT